MKLLNELCLMFATLGLAIAFFFVSGAPRTSRYAVPASYYNSGASYTGGYSGATSTGGYSGATSTGGYSGASSTGGYSGASSTGGYSGASSTGGYNGASSTGEYGGASSTGEYSGASSTGEYGNTSSTGENSEASSTGGYGTGSSTGGYSTGSSTSGYGTGSSTAGYGTGSSTAGYGTASSTGGYSGASSTGRYGDTASTGGYSGASSTDAYGDTNSGAYGDTTSTGEYGTASFTGGYSESYGNSTNSLVETFEGIENLNQTGTVVPTELIKEIDPIKDANVTCDNVKPFPKSDFAKYGEDNKIYISPTSLPKSSMFYSLGFTKYVRVFGIPMLGTDDVEDSKLSHASKILAEYIDNNKDGTPDDLESLIKLDNYTVVFGFLDSATQSEFFWNERYMKVENAPFREQFVCNMHFFEQWSSDISPYFYNVENGNTTDAKNCFATSTAFDWPLWYFPFTLAYYDYYYFSNQTKVIFKEAMKNALNDIFHSRYLEDEEMQMAEFFAWSLITKLKGLECYCESEEIRRFWKICTSKELYDFDNIFYKELDSLKFLPKRLPSGKYDSPAVVANGIISVSENQNTSEDKLNQNSASNSTIKLVDEQQHNGEAAQNTTSINL